ncbi:DUF262 domain-containing protein [Listeria monocytogenes]|nr:DUF262 domain-containing protein [Listeria monocytogenes]
MEELEVERVVYFNEKIAHHNIHAFMDGNKRTALNYFLDLIHKYTKFYIKDVLKIQDGQIHYLTSEISEEEFIQIILNEVKLKMVKKNTKCQLEHLIPRVEIDEETESASVAQVDRRSSFTLTDLEKGQFFYQQLKKPYFQRDTNEWSVDRVEKLIDTFLEDGLIPAIILWETNEGDTLIIDGAHRVSSLIAWVNDDYGDVNVSSSNNHHALSEYFNERIGNYNTIKTSQDEKFKKIKQIIAKKSIPLQWVAGDYDKVKESFIRINEQGVTLSNDEKELIQKDKLPTSKLARAILSHGTGQNSKYKTENNFKIFELFFLPTLIKENLVYPMLGAIDEDFVISKVYNVLKIIDEDQSESVSDLETIILEFSNFSQNILQISNKVYFYGANQHYKTSSLFGFTLFTKELMLDKMLLEKYLKFRKLFEEFLVENERFVQAISRKRRQSSKAYIDISDYYKTVLDSIALNNENYIFEKFPYLSKNKSKLTQRQVEIDKKYRIFLSETPRCTVCQGYIDGPKDENLVHECCKI